jgi:hypothetical protein
MQKFRMLYVDLNRYMVHENLSGTKKFRKDYLKRFHLSGPSDQFFWIGLELRLTDCRATPILTY